MSFVVVPRFKLTDQRLDAFLEAAQNDASQSLADEAGCHQFDICVDRSSQPVEVLFYEVYADRSAFEAHLRTAHVAAFRAAILPGEEGPVQFFDRAAA
ncbi:MAG: putative quinol monooxygenase [Limimaricola soesokkakensis]|uniref:putative quinol monooxygenase n=1 Tax=Limimaricola soesokkakensis TaxID=1343159 RepID=UPI004057EE15